MQSAVQLAKEHRLALDSKELAVLLDSVDPIGRFRSQFYIPFAVDVARGEGKGALRGQLAKSRPSATARHPRKPALPNS
jgi:hypothetical protein